MNVDFKGYGENVATFIADDTVEAGTIVKIKDNYTVTACSSGNTIAGVCINVRDGYAAVQLSGYVELSADKKIPVGSQIITAGTKNSVTTGTAGNSYCVIYSDTNTVGFIL